VSYKEVQEVQEVQTVQDQRTAELREQVHAIVSESFKPTPESELLQGTFEERRAKARAVLEEEARKARADAS
jgi:hypothetical protein